MNRGVKVRTLLALLLLSQSLNATVITGNLVDLTGQPAGTDRSVVFELMNCGSNPALVVGSAVIVPITTNVVPNSASMLTGTLVGNDVIQCGSTVGQTYYKVSLNNGSQTIYTKNYYISGSTWDITTANALDSDPTAFLNGGYLIGDIIYGAGTNTLGILRGNQTTTKKYLSQHGNGTTPLPPVWETVTSSEVLPALSGDVSSSGGSPVVQVTQVGGVSAANVANWATAAGNATDASTAGRIVKRDASGNFAAGTVSLKGLLVNDPTASTTLTVQAGAGQSTNPLLKFMAAARTTEYGRWAHNGKLLIGTTTEISANYPVQNVSATGLAGYYAKSTLPTSSSNVGLFGDATNAFVGLVQNNSAKAGTLAGITQANLGALLVGLSNTGLLIGTQTRVPMHLATNGIERVRIMGGGNVLIGTTTDDASNKLQVNGGISATAFTRTGVPDGCATFASGALNSTGSACGTGTSGAASAQQLTDLKATKASTVLTIAAGTYRINGVTYAMAKQQITILSGAVSSLVNANPARIAVPQAIYEALLDSDTVTIQGAAGTGCSGLNGTFAITKYDHGLHYLQLGSTNLSGCTYTPSSATIGGSSSGAVKVYGSTSGLIHVIAPSASGLIAACAAGTCTFRQEAAPAFDADVFPIATVALTPSGTPSLAQWGTITDERAAFSSRHFEPGLGMQCDPTKTTCGVTPDVLRTGENNTITGEFDASGATKTAPNRSGTGAPAASCEVSDTYFREDATAGQNLYLCTSTNTWTQVTGSSASPGASAFSNYQARVTNYTGVPASGTGTVYSVRIPGGTIAAGKCALISFGVNTSVAGATYDIGIGLGATTWRPIQGAGASTNWVGEVKLCNDAGSTRVQQLYGNFHNNNGSTMYVGHTNLDNNAQAFAVDTTVDQTLSLKMLSYSGTTQHWGLYWHVQYVP